MKKKKHGQNVLLFFGVQIGLGNFIKLITISGFIFYRNITQIYCYRQNTERNGGTNWYIKGANLRDLKIYDCAGLVSLWCSSFNSVSRHADNYGVQALLLLELQMIPGHLWMVNGLEMGLPSSVSFEHLSIWWPGCILLKCP